MTALLDWSVIVGAFSVASTALVKWIIPGVMALTRDGSGGTGQAQAASRDLVEAIDRAVTQLGTRMDSEILRMTEWRTGQRNLGEHVLEQITGLTKEQAVLADSMARLADAVAVVQRQQEEQVRELEEWSTKHGDAFAQIQQNAETLTAIKKKLKL